MKTRFLIFIFLYGATFTAAQTGITSYDNLLYKLPFWFTDTEAFQLIQDAYDYSGGNEYTISVTPGSADSLKLSPVHTLPGKFSGRVSLTSSVPFNEEGKTKPAWLLSGLLSMSPENKAVLSLRRTITSQKTYYSLTAALSIHSHSLSISAGNLRCSVGNGIVLGSLLPRYSLLQRRNTGISSFTNINSRMRPGDVTGIITEYALPFLKLNAGFLYTEVKGEYSAISDETVWLPVTDYIYFSGTENHGLPARTYFISAETTVSRMLSFHFSGYRVNTETYSSGNKTTPDTYTPISLSGMYRTANDKLIIECAALTGNTTLSDNTALSAEYGLHRGQFSLLFSALHTSPNYYSPFASSAVQKLHSLGGGTDIRALSDFVVNNLTISLFLNSVFNSQQTASDYSENNTGVQCRYSTRELEGGISIFSREKSVDEHIIFSQLKTALTLQYSPGNDFSSHLKIELSNRSGITKSEALNISQLIEKQLTQRLNASVGFGFYTTAVNGLFTVLSSDEPYTFNEIDLKGNGYFFAVSGDYNYSGSLKIKMGLKRNYYSSIPFSAYLQLQSGL